MRSKALLRLSLLAAAATAAAGIAVVERGGAPATHRAAPAERTAAGDGLTVIELFTSQACSSCPPAEAFLAHLAAQHDDLLALEFHVTYWDDYVDGSRGRWQDVFADPAHTRRQREYNRRLRGREAIYTPQMIVGGSIEANGLAEDQVLSAFDVQRRRPAPPVAIEIDWTDGGLTVALSGRGQNDGSDAQVWLVTYDAAARTLVKGGENMGRVLDNHNIVRDLAHLANWSGGALTVPVGDVLLAPNQRCAVLVQHPDLGPIIAAAHCPAAPT